MTLSHDLAAGIVDARALAHSSDTTISHRVNSTNW